MENLTRPSSHVQRLIEAALLEADERQRVVDQLLIKIEECKTRAHQVAISAFGEELASAAVKMAAMSLPAIYEIKARQAAEQKAVVVEHPGVEASQSVQVPESDQVPRQSVVQPTAVPASSRDYLETDSGVRNPDFFDVDVPPPRVQEGYAILAEVETAYRQNQKENPYGNDRGKNSWRKALFAKALEHFYKSGMSGESASEETSVAFEETEAAVISFKNDVPLTDSDTEVVQEPGPEDHSEEIDGQEANFDADEDVLVSPTDVSLDVDEVSLEPVAAADFVADQFVVDAPEISLENDNGESVRDDRIDSFIPDFGSPDDDDNDAYSADVSDDAQDIDDDQAADETFSVPSDRTFELSETFFSEDVTIEEPMATTEVEPVETVIEKPVVEQVSVAREASKSAPVADDMDDGPVTLPPSAARAVAASSLPPAMRPRMMAPVSAQVQKPAPSEPIAPTGGVTPPVAQSASAPSRPPIGRAPMPQRSAPTPAAVAKPSEPTAVSPAPSEPAQPAKPSAPATPRPVIMPRPAMQRRPAQAQAAPVRQHGYGNAVPAPDGLAAALEEKRKAEEAQGVAPSTQPVTRTPPPPPVRPGPPISRPSFSSPIRR